jgi:hypothetical protein
MAGIVVSCRGSELGGKADPPSKYGVSTIARQALGLPGNSISFCTYGKAALPGKKSFLD